MTGSEQYLPRGNPKSDRIKLARLSVLVAKAEFIARCKSKSHKAKDSPYLAKALSAWYRGGMQDDVTALLHENILESAKALNKPCSDWNAGDREAAHAVMASCLLRRLQAAMRSPGSPIKGGIVRRKRLSATTRRQAVKQTEHAEFCNIIFHIKKGMWAATEGFELNLTNIDHYIQKHSDVIEEIENTTSTSAAVKVYLRHHGIDFDDSDKQRKEVTRLAKRYSRHQL